MPASVILTVFEGALKGKTFRLEERAVLLIGKEADCHLRFPQDEQHRTISRHHCLLDISPPLIRLRDLNSLNGTFVNGRRIGRGARKVEERGDAEIDLKHGDEVRLGPSGAVGLRVEVRVPLTCYGCGAEIGQESDAMATLRSGALFCAKCQHGRQTMGHGKGGHEGPACARCGKTLAAAEGRFGAGETLCGECTAHPSAVAQRILDLANAGAEKLKALDHFEIIRELGRGGMGRVYLARHDQTGAEVALKVMQPQAAVDKKAKQLFFREIENTHLLKHPNIVRLFDCGIAAGAFYFSMEYCAGGSLEALLKQRGPLPLEEAGSIILQTLSGLEHAHNVEIPAIFLEDGRAVTARGLVHRDLKPHNIFLSPRVGGGRGGAWNAKVGDFGLAKAFDTAGLSGLTWTGTCAGTPFFMPRQQVIDFLYAKPEVDVWAAAACFYFMLTGVAPRSFPPQADVWQTVLETRAVPIARRLVHLPRRVTEVIDYALTDNPGIPYKTAGELKAALEAVL